MDLQKLKINQFNHISLVNFPQDIDLGIISDNNNIEVVIYYINKVEDIQNFVNYCNSIDLPKDNRTILVFKKGRKDEVNRDRIITPFRQNKFEDFTFKAPMLCSLSKELSAFVLAKKME
ncbi:MAG: hypothetical protein C0597_03800 [Marinilabiliales bacterium]|nr:MAG: hypothetical protein C0597_03800 [Marinilabiliales bacterium]